MRFSTAKHPPSPKCGEGSTGPNKTDPSNYVGPALFLDEVTAYVYMHELGIADTAEPVPVLVEIREVSIGEFKEFERKERL